MTLKTYLSKSFILTYSMAFHIFHNTSSWIHDYLISSFQLLRKIVAKCYLNLWGERAINCSIDFRNTWKYFLFKYLRETYDSVLGCAKGCSQQCAGGSLVSGVHGGSFLGPHWGCFSLLCAHAQASPSPTCWFRRQNKNSHKGGGVWVQSKRDKQRARNLAATADRFLTGQRLACRLLTSALFGAKSLGPQCLNLRDSDRRHAEWRVYTLFLYVHSLSAGCQE